MGSSGDQANRGFIHPRQLLWKLTDATRQFRQRQLLTADQALGRKGEDVAHRYLRGKGLQIMARNFRLPDGSGEIDIVARTAATLVFVEVKARRSSAYGAPERAIDPEKQRRIIRAARSYVLRCGADWSLVRFDIVAIVFTNPPSITHYEDAFFPKRTI